MREASGGLVDPDILDILYSFNSMRCVTTVSSCSGRIVVISAPLPGDKKHGGIVASWHRPVTVEELMEAIRLARHVFTWVSVQPVVLALYVHGRREAEAVAEALVKAGMKYTGLRPAHTCSETYYVFSMGTERLDIPVSFRGHRLIGDRDIAVIVEMLNTYLSLAKRKLESLRRAASLLHNLLGCGDEATLWGGVTGTDLTEPSTC